MFYRLENKVPVPCSAEAAAAFFKDERRFIARDTAGNYTISTVFTVVDHQWEAKAEPILFETAVFDAEDERVEVQFYATYADAEAGHQALLKDYQRSH